MDIEATLRTLFHGSQLKQTARTGWGQRGVRGAESVADHSYGVAFVVLVLAPLLEEPVNMGKALALAILHDLPEALTSDIPSPAWRLMPESIKPQTEGRAMTQIVGDSAGKDTLLALWHELKESVTVEARLVHDADKLDLYLQATIYEQQSNNRRLSEFWQKPADFNFLEAQRLYETLKLRRQGNNEDFNTS